MLYLFPEYLAQGLTHNEALNKYQEIELDQQDNIPYLSHDITLNISTHDKTPRYGGNEPYINTKITTKRKRVSGMKAFKVLLRPEL